MNLILLEKEEEIGFFSIKDPRSDHILNIIKSEEGDTLDIGVIGGLKGKLTITKIDDKGITYKCNLDKESPKLYPVTFIIGTPRPPVAKRLLKDLSTSGVSKIVMCATDLGEKTYLTSNLWKDEKYMEYLIDGGVQAESTLIPTIERYFSLKKALESLPENIDRIAMDNIDPDFPISGYKPEFNETVVCIGGERGFSDRERAMLREFGFKIFKMGERVLRTETSCHLVLGSILTSRNLI